MPAVSLEWQVDILLTKSDMSHSETFRKEQTWLVVGRWYDFSCGSMRKDQNLRCSWKLSRNAPSQHTSIIQKNNWHANSPSAPGPLTRLEFFEQVYPAELPRYLSIPLSNWWLVQNQLLVTVIYIEGFLKWEYMGIPTNYPKLSKIRQCLYWWFLDVFGDSPIEEASIN